MDLKLSFKNVSFEGRGRVICETASGLKKIIIKDGNEEIPDSFSADFIVQEGGEIFGKLRAKIINFIGGFNNGIEAEELNVCGATLKGDNFVHDTANFYGKSILDGNLYVKNELKLDNNSKINYGSHVRVEGDTFILDNSLIEGRLITRKLEVAGQPTFSEISEITVNSEKVNPKNVLKRFRRK
ncbi:MAG TPA: hypothetical protein PKI94_06120 [Candidatus Gastranaerophilaceae bacterium]|nr:hypothetical protein [Candidatus Gastranaerophilaceae bacterium]